MRVTGGSDRGRKIRTPRSSGTRPTASRVREAIFNILGPPPEGPVLDLYAGTGAMGIEALSRGASRAVFVERDSRALSILSRNLRELGLADRAAILGTNVRNALSRLDPGTEPFAWVFIDPPYATSEAERALSLLAGSDALAPGAVIVIEHDKRRLPPEAAGDLKLMDRRFYGDTGISFYRRTTGLV
jgi:16S rRNA (guanine966-N2)-methyltransferase